MILADISLGFGVLLILLLAFLFISIFKKNILINLSIFFICIGIIAVVLDTTIESDNWITYAMLCIIAYEFWEISKGRTK